MAVNPIEPYTYFNRDLSWLKFNERVLAQALESRMPLLERVRFMAIFSTNLDEFFMKRVGYLKRAMSSSIPVVGNDQVAPAKLLQDVRAVILKHIDQRQTIYEKHLLPDLQKNGIQFLRFSDLSEAERESAVEYFRNKVFPVLTPLAVDRSHPFPFLSNLSVSLGITLHYPKKNERLFARLKIPNTLPQWVQIAGGKDTDYKLVRLQDVLENNLSELFPEMVIESSMPFRVTRNADIGDVADDLEDRLDLVEQELRQRRVANIVRLEHSKPVGGSMLNFLRDQLELREDDLYEIPGEISYHPLHEIANLNIPKLRFPPHSPVKPKVLAEEDMDIFSIIRDRDVLVHHPYDSYSETVEKFLLEAVNDPNVLAIKITLYRAGENSPIIPLLIRAAEKGKQVVAVIELKARFDEARNISSSEQLEDAGIHVVYGVMGKKIHAKTILVIRQEQDTYRFYSHIATGNYNSNTAKLYTDYGLFTADKRIGTELIEFFNFLTGLSLKKNYQKLLVAPVNMRKRFVQYIKKEIENAKAGLPSRIIAKMNSLEDQEICDLLYDASKAGIKVDLIVRGFCTLRPGVQGMSENIRVVSVIGRFLEHSRVFYFRRGAEQPGDGKFYIGSADWMHRNLNNRMEVVVPIEDLNQKTQLLNSLEYMLTDKVQGWELQPDGSYVLHKADKDSVGTHDYLIKTTGV
jgi:polyphosphate kinase